MKNVVILRGEIWGVVSQSVSDEEKTWCLMCKNVVTASNEQYNEKNSPITHWCFTRWVKCQSAAFVPESRGSRRDQVGEILLTWKRPDTRRWHAAAAWRAHSAQTHLCDANFIPSLARPPSVSHFYEFVLRSILAPLPHDWHPEAEKHFTSLNNCCMWYNEYICKFPIFASIFFTFVDTE